MVTNSKKLFTSEVREQRERCWIDVRDLINFSDWPQITWIFALITFGICSNFRKLLNVSLNSVSPKKEHLSQTHDSPQRMRVCFPLKFSTDKLFKEGTLILNIITLSSWVRFTTKLSRTSQPSRSFARDSSPENLTDKSCKLLSDGKQNQGGTSSEQPWTSHHHLWFGLQPNIQEPDKLVKDLQ